MSIFFDLKKIFIILYILLLDFILSIFYILILIIYNFRTACIPNLLPINFLHKNLNPINSPLNPLHILLLIHPIPNYQPLNLPNLSLPIILSIIYLTILYNLIYNTYLYLFISFQFSLNNKINIS